MDSPIENLINEITDNYNKGCRNVFVGQPLIILFYGAFMPSLRRSL